MVDLLNLIFQTVHGEINAVSTECRCINNMASCFNISFLKGLDHIFVLKHPALCADTSWHSCFHQVGTGSTIQQQDMVLSQFLKFLFCHMFISSLWQPITVGKKIRLLL